MPITELVPGVAPPKKKPKFPFPVKESCYGTFREDAPEERMEKCRSCGKYIDCIQLSYKRRRQFRQEIGRLAKNLRTRIEDLSDKASSSAA